MAAQHGVATFRRHDGQDGGFEHETHELVRLLVQDDGGEILVHHGLRPLGQRACRASRQDGGKQDAGDPPLGLLEQAGEILLWKVRSQADPCQGGKLFAGERQIVAPIPAISASTTRRASEISGSWRPVTIRVRWAGCSSTKASRNVITACEAFTRWMSSSTSMKGSGISC